MELIPHNINVNFLAKAKVAIFISFLLIGASFFEWFSTGQEKFGVDFLGGNEIVARVEGAKSDEIRKALTKGGIENALVQSFEISSHEYSIRIGGDSEEAGSVARDVERVLSASFPDKVEVLKTDFVGPTIGKELRRNALIAVVLGLLVILAYISFRFEVAFALGAVTALFHDIIVPMGIYVFAGYTVSMATLAAALTIVGYSVNDTIVIFDRVREEAMKRKKFNIRELINECLNCTLSRTIITSLLTLFSVVALLVYGGGAIAELSFFLFVGLLSGTYSTIYIAAPVAIMWHRYRGGSEEVEL